MGAFDSLMSCSIGPASFQLDRYNVRVEPVTEEGRGRVGRRVRVEGEGYISAATPAAFTAALSAVRTAFDGSGQTLRITGIGGEVEYELTSGASLDGGPHYGYSIDAAPTGGAALHRRVRFTVEADTAPADTGGGGGGEPQYEVSIETRPDGLQRITRRGTLTGPTALAQFSALLASARSTFAPNTHVISHKYETNLQQTRVQFEITIEQIVGDLPIGSSAAAVDGTLTISTSIDAQKRVTETHSWDLLVVGDVLSLRGELTPVGDGLVILSERFEVTTLREHRLRAEWVILRGDGTDLLDWEQSIEVQEDGDRRAAADYPGASPLFYVAARMPATASQRGRAVGLKRFPNVPPPLWGTAALESPGRVTRKRISENECETTWEYRFLLNEQQVSAVDALSIAQATSRTVGGEFLA